MDYSKLTKKQIIDAIINDEITFQNILEEQLNDKEVVLELVKKNGLILYYASENLQNDKDVVLEAVKQNGFALIHASKSLQSNKDLLECLEKKEFDNKWSSYYKSFYKEKIELLESIRNQEEKEIIQNLINPSNKETKKIKF